MGTSWRASCPRWLCLRRDSLPMITLFLSQGDFCATAYNAFYKATAHSTTLRKAYFGVTYASIRSFYSELAPLLGEYEVVISTHFMQTYALLKAKHSLGLPTKIIAYVPDFDHSCIHVPCYASLQVDAVLAQGTLLLEKLAHLYNFAPERLQRAGFLPR